MEAFFAPMLLAIERTFELGPLFMILAGSFVGLVFGFIPGLQSITALSVFLPITFWWDPVLAMYFFAGIIGAAGSGGSVTAILLNMPGTSQNVVTMIEGYPMTRQGKSVYALNLSASAAWLGALVGILVLMLLIPIFLPILLSFGPAETFWIAVIGLITLVVAISRTIVKGMVAVGIGVFLSTIGFGGPGMPVPRFTYGSNYLLDGLHLVMIVIGLLVISEAIVNLVGSRSSANGQVRARASFPTLQWPEIRKQMRDGLLEPFRHLGIFVRSSGIGTFVGAMPGVGGSVAQFMSYNVALASAKEPEKFGHGSVEGFIATEAATNSKEGGSLLPTLLFGIPGTAEMALVLGAWQLHGLDPGPSFMSQHADLAWALIFGLLISNLITSIVMVGSSPLLSRIPNIDVRLVSPAVIVASLLAVYSVRQNFWDIVAVMLIGVFGYFQKAYGYPVIGTVIGFVLGSVIEDNFHFALQSSLGSYWVFVGSTTSIILVVLSLLALAWTVRQVLRDRRQARLFSAAASDKGGQVEGAQ